MPSFRSSLRAPFVALVLGVTLHSMHATSPPKRYTEVCTYSANYNGYSTIKNWMSQAGTQQCFVKGWEVDPTNEWYKILIDTSRAQRMSAKGLMDHLWRLMCAENCRTFKRGSSDEKSALEHLHSYPFRNIYKDLLCQLGPMSLDDIFKTMVQANTTACPNQQYQPPKWEVLVDEMMKPEEEEEEETVKTKSGARSHHTIASLFGFLLASMAFLWL